MSGGAVHAIVGEPGTTAKAWHTSGRAYESSRLMVKGGLALPAHVAARSLTHTALRPLLPSAGSTIGAMGSAPAAGGVDSDHVAKDAAASVVCQSHPDPMRVNTGARVAVPAGASTTASYASVEAADAAAAAAG